VVPAIARLLPLAVTALALTALAGAARIRTSALRHRRAPPPIEAVGQS
jgi:hypothetical protein